MIYKKTKFTSKIFGDFYIVTFNILLIFFCRYKEAGWARLFHSWYGIHWTCTEPMFSERYGHRKPFISIGKWRFKWLKPLSNRSI